MGAPGGGGGRRGARRDMGCVWGFPLRFLFCRQESEGFNTQRGALLLFWSQLFRVHSEEGSEMPSALILLSRGPVRRQHPLVLLPAPLLSRAALTSSCPCSVEPQAPMRV